MQKAKYNKNQFLYILEATLEYFISIVVAGSYLATLTTYLGFSDSLTGILSAIISLGGLFQLISMLIRRRKMKRFVVIFSIANQLLFAFLYVVPFFSLSANLKRIIFVAIIVLAYFVYNVVHPKKINWMMSLVDDGIRGRFTANKEIVSLVGGMAFTFLMGNMVDHFKAKGEIKTAFIICGITIFVLMMGHTLSMLLTSEVEENTSTQNKKLFSQIGEAFKNKDVQKITLLFILWHIATGIAEPFNSVYMIKELSLSLTFISVLGIIQAVIRVLCSRALGKYADKNSFAKMLRICFVFAFLGFLAVTVAFPTNKGINLFGYNLTYGKIACILHFATHGVAMAGINSALINLIFDYVPFDTRADSLAVTQSFSGLMGFLSTFVAGLLVTYIQQNGNSIFGVTVYAQQVLNLMAAVITVGIMLFLQLGIINKEKK
ncbi:MAG: MFS transporter [Clostridia bacterium]|nr:MFS transporter [Clostridia bacterium]